MAMSVAEVIEIFDKTGILFTQDSTMYTKLSTTDYLKALKKAIEEEEKTLQELPH